jgi:hypothetical protein
LNPSAGTETPTATSKSRCGRGSSRRSSGPRRASARRGRVPSTTRRTPHPRRKLGSAIPGDFVAPDRNARSSTGSRNTRSFPMDLTCKAIRHGSKLFPGRRHGPCKPPERPSFVRPVVRDRRSAHGEPTGIWVKVAPRCEPWRRPGTVETETRRKIDDAHPVQPAPPAAHALPAPDALRPVARPAQSVRSGHLPERSRMISPVAVNSPQPGGVTRPR